MTGKTYSKRPFDLLDALLGVHLDGRRAHHHGDGGAHGEHDAGADGRDDARDGRKGRLLGGLDRGGILFQGLGRSAYYGISL